MAAKSKSKGKGGERQVCKIFENEFGGSWQRVFSSGAFVGGKNSSRKEFLSDGQIKNAKADVVPPDEMNIVIESKAYSVFPWHRLIQQEPIPQLDEWLTEIYTCIDDGEFWLLCVKIDYKGWFVLFDPTFAEFNIGNHAQYYSTTYNKSFIVTSPLEWFLKTNRDSILLLTKNKS